MPSILVSKVDHVPVIDGTLDDGVWTKAKGIKGSFFKNLAERYKKN